ncbi:MAG: hypothetical protein HQK83_10580 [Fibrobacteria bacterium]|nr:hypothetical protein [Fibrobacteria bacterium]
MRLLTIFLLLPAISFSQTIRPWTENPFYWEYKGKPILLTGGSDDDNLFQMANLEAHLEELHQTGANYIRNTMSDRDAGNMKAFFQQPNGKYDLDQWNNEYWTAFENLLTWCEDREIIIQIEVWDRFDHSRNPWLISAWHPDNNVNYTNAESGLADTYPNHPGTNEQPFFKTVPDMQNNTVLMRYQNSFVEKLLSYSLQHNNVLYTMDNETQADPKWAIYWSNFIKAKAQEMGKIVQTTEMWDAWNIMSDEHKATFDHPEQYSFVDISQNSHNSGQTNWDNIQWAREYLSGAERPLNSVKIYGADGGSYGNSADAVERFWRNLIGGMASSRFHRPTAGLGLNETAQNAIRAMRKLESLIKLWDVEPNMELLSGRSDNEAYLAAKPGELYALYFTDGGSVDLELSTFSGRFILNWIDIVNGEWGDKDTLIGGTKVTVDAPGTGGWTAAVVKEEIVSVLRKPKFRIERKRNAYTVTGRKADVEVLNSKSMSRKYYYPVFMFF